MNNDRDNDHDNDHANDNDKGDRDKPESKQVAPPPAGGALASLAGLQKMLAGVSTAAITGRVGLPMMLFKREGSGTWMFGQKRTIVEPGSRWAVNPMTFQYGFISFNDNNKRADERLVSVGQPKPLATELPNTGFSWQEEWAVNMKCLDGADAGVEVIYKANTDGGIKAIVITLDEVRNRLNGGQHDGNIVPIVVHDKDSYVHKQYGKTWLPILNIVGWMSFDGPAPAPTPEPTPTPSPTSPGADQPRRRRVA